MAEARNERVNFDREETILLLKAKLANDDPLEHVKKYLPMLPEKTRNLYQKSTRAKLDKRLEDKFGRIMSGFKDDEIRKLAEKIADKMKKGRQHFEPKGSAHALQVKADMKPVKEEGPKHKQMATPLRKEDLYTEDTAKNKRVNFVREETIFLLEAKLTDVDPLKHMEKNLSKLPEKNKNLYQTPPLENHRKRLEDEFDRVMSLFEDDKIRILAEKIVDKRKKERENAPPKCSADALPDIKPIKDENPKDEPIATPKRQEDEYTRDIASKASFKMSEMIRPESESEF